MLNINKKFEAGYAGKDAMRDKAKKLMGNEFKNVTMTYPRSDSAPDKVPMRHYKKGGKVACMAVGGAAKIRHKEATPAGMPIKKRVHRSKL